MILVTCRSGGFLTLVDHLSGLVSGVVFTVSAGSGVSIVRVEYHLRLAGRYLVMVEGCRPPYQTWLELLGKCDLPCYVIIQEGLRWSLGWMAMAI